MAVPFVEGTDAPSFDHPFVAGFSAVVVEFCRCGGSSRRADDEEEDAVGAGRSAVTDRVDTTSSRPRIVVLPFTNACLPHPGVCAVEGFAELEALPLLIGGGCAEDCEVSSHALLAILEGKTLDARRGVGRNATRKEVPFVLEVGFPRLYHRTGGRVVQLREKSKPQAVVGLQVSRYRR